MYWVLGSPGALHLWVWQEFCLHQVFWQPTNRLELLVQWHSKHTIILEQISTIRVLLHGLPTAAILLYVFTVTGQATALYLGLDILLDLTHVTSPLLCLTRGLRLSLKSKHLDRSILARLTRSSSRELCTSTRNTRPHPNLPQLNWG